MPLKFQREGIKYDELSEDEKETWDAIEWDEDGSVPAAVDPAALNKWLFNADTIDKVLQHLMAQGLKVADGDRLGKTIIFAKNSDHARFIVERFDANYPHFKGSFCRQIDFSVNYAQTLIDEFSRKDSAPHIAVSVDMLDTGIDVPEIVNLVFFKIVRSKTKFWQMIGRGTRLCPDLFGPGRHKEFFYIFDFCQNFEFFNQNPQTVDGATGPSLTERLFAERVELIGEIDSARPFSDAEGEVGERNLPFRHHSAATPLQELRASLVGRLRDEIAAMTLDNFLVRPKRKFVERFAKPQPWSVLSYDARRELIEEVAGLPSGLVDDDTAAKEFDLLVLKTQLAILRAEKHLPRLRKSVVELCSALEELTNVPAVAAQLTLIQEVQTDEYWQDITAPMLETIRRRLRNLIKLIEWKKRPTIYSNFVDEIGAGAEFELQGMDVGTDMAKFRMKARHFLKEHDNHLAIQKLRRNEPLTRTDLAELERMFVSEGVANKAALDLLCAQGGLGVFIRSLVGLDREAANAAFADFLADKALTANQIEFVNLIIDHLTEQGLMDPALLYESPFTDRNPSGVAGIFDDRKAGQVINIVEEVNRRAAA